MDFDTSFRLDTSYILPKVLGLMSEGPTVGARVFAAGAIVYAVGPESMISVSALFIFSFFGEFYST